MYLLLDVANQWKRSVAALEKGMSFFVSSVTIAKAVNINFH